MLWIESVSILKMRQKLYNSDFIRAPSLLIKRNAPARKTQTSPKVKHFNQRGMLWNKGGRCFHCNSRRDHYSFVSLVEGSVTWLGSQMLGYMTQNAESHRMHSVGPCHTPRLHLHSLHSLRISDGMLKTNTCMILLSSICSNKTNDKYVQLWSFQFKSEGNKCLDLAQLCH